MIGSGTLRALHLQRDRCLGCMLQPACVEPDPMHSAWQTLPEVWYVVEQQVGIVHENQGRIYPCSSIALISRQPIVRD